MEQIYTIPVNEAFEASAEDKSCGCPFCTLYNKLENDELCKVVNLETIAKYGLRQTNSTKVQVIVDMLNRLCVGKGCVPEPLRQKIEELEEHIIALETPRPVTQNNHGCQNFYGNITDSDFHS